MFWFLVYLKTRGDSRSFGSWPKNPVFHVVKCIFSVHIQQAHNVFPGPSLFSFHPLVCGLRWATRGPCTSLNPAFFLGSLTSGRSVPLLGNIHTWLSRTIFPAVYLDSHLWVRFSGFHEGIVMQSPMIVACSAWIGKSECVPFDSSSWFQRIMNHLNAFFLRERWLYTYKTLEGGLC